MPPRNNPVPNAVRLFNCSICDKGYSRQVDYENHLRSYDHNHRQRLADMKKLTAGNETESNKPKQSLDMRSINVEDANKKPGVGSRFTKIGGNGSVAAGGSRFKKVGVKAGEKVEEKNVEKEPMEEKAVVNTAKHADTTEVDEEDRDIPKPSIESSNNEDVIMDDQGAEQLEDEDDKEEEEITWEEYDFTKPTGCDHQNCPGCKTEGIWSNEWVAIEAA